MATMKHPTIPDYHVDVPDAEQGKWRDAGWLGPRARGPQPSEPAEDVDRSKQKPPRATT